MIKYSIYFLNLYNYYKRVCSALSFAFCFCTYTNEIMYHFGFCRFIRSCKKIYLFDIIINLHICNDAHCLQTSKFVQISNQTWKITLVTITRPVKLACFTKLPYHHPARTFRYCLLGG